MAKLPIERLQPSPSFYVTGIDYFGPYTIKGEVQKRVRAKCFGVIFTCFVARAVYLDISQDYSTDSFLLVLRRFAKMHGWPNRIHSDKGSQLVCASKDLKTAVKNMDERKLDQFGVEKGVKWTFSPPDAPWMNGATEALIKSVKSALNTSVGDHIMTYSELQTVMFECAQIVNQRPIGKYPTNPNDGSYLCANDLILGSASSKVPQGPFQERTSFKHRFDFIQKITESFWKKWSRDFFPGLIIRNKWHVEQRNIQVVLIKDSNAVRGEWKMGRVTKTYPADDGKVRRVSLIYTNARNFENTVTKSEVERAVHNLIAIVPVE